MSQPLRRNAALALLAVPAVLIAGCAKNDSPSASGGSGAGGTGNTVTIAVTDDGCAPSPASVPAGAYTFTVTNKDASRVTEAEILQNGRILGEKENLTPGLSGSFSLRLTAGQYVIQCPNASTDQTTFTVTANAGSTQAVADTTLATAVGSYQSYLVNQANALVPATKAFTDAVKAGDIEKAKPLFAPARAFYERIEPVAESFGDLDPEIDARDGDVDPATWTGFHRIEKDLWGGSITAVGPVADKLLADVTRLQGLVRTVKLQPAEIANGAVDLLGEVAKSKITGEEDRYSHTDLWDFEANVAGAREAFQVLEPVLKQKNPQLATDLNTRFADVLKALSKYQKGSGYVDYSTVDAAGRRGLTTVVDALAEPLSKVAPAIV